MESGGDAQSDPIEGGRSQSDRTDTASARARWQVWTSVVGAVVVCVGLVLCLSYRNSHRASSAYHAYAGQRWYLQLPTSSPGYIELGDAGVFKAYDTQVEFFGTYAITRNGRLRVRWNSVSTGTPSFDQTVVDALAPLVGDFTEKINKEDKTTMIKPISSTSFSLDVEGHKLTFAERPDTPSSIPPSFSPAIGPAALSYTQQTGVRCTDHTTSGAAYAENVSRPSILRVGLAVLAVHAAVWAPL